MIKRHVARDCVTVDTMITAVPKSTLTTNTVEGWCFGIDVVASGGIVEHDADASACV